MRLAARCRGAVAVLAVVLVSACAGTPPSAPQAGAGSASFSGFIVGSPVTWPAVSLSAADGRPVDLAADRGRSVSLVFPGYTNCPDACPLTLATIALALNRLSTAEQDRVQVYLLTLDPARDTPAVLGQYLRQFHPRFRGLTGSAAQLRQVYRALGLVDPLASPDGAVEHTVAAYAFGLDGQARLAYDTSTTPQGLAADLRLLLAGREPPAQDPSTLAVTGGLARAGYTSVVGAFLRPAVARTDAAELTMTAPNSDRTDERITGVSIEGVAATLLSNGKSAASLVLPAQSATVIGRDIRIRFTGLPPDLRSRPQVDVAVTFASAGLVLVRVPVTAAGPSG